MRYYSSKLLVCITLFYTVILRTTKYILQSTTPVLFCTTLYYKVQQNISEYCKVQTPTSLFDGRNVHMNETTSTLRRATSGMQSKLQRRHSGLTFPTRETPSRMRRASAVTLQHHQTLSLPRKMTLMIDAPHI